jgi:hypothetical protein
MLNLFIEEFIFTVKTDNAGTSGTNQFTLPTTGSVMIVL